MLISKLFNAQYSKGSFTLERSVAEQSSIFSHFYCMLNEAYPSIVQRCSLM